MFFQQTRSGRLDFFKFNRLVESIYSRQWDSKYTRSQLVALVREAAASSSTPTVGFQDFLYVVRQCQEIVVADRLRREHAVILKTECSQLEVIEFRAEFLGPTERTELCFDDVCSMLQRVMSLSSRRQAEIRHEYLKALGCDLAGKHETMEFPEFLFFMRRLIDLDVIGSLLGT